MKRILFISHDAYLYGATRSMVDLIDGLNKVQGYEYMVVLPYEGPIEELLKQKQIPYVIIPFQRSVYFSSGDLPAAQRLKVNLKLYKHFKSLKKSFKPNLVYCNTSTSYFPLFLFKFWGVKTLIHLREYGFEDYRIFHDWGGKLLRLAMKLSDFILVNSASLQAHYQLKYGVQSRVLYNGICTAAEFDERKALGNISEIGAEGFFNIGMVGNINENKGQEMCLNAFELLSGEFPKLRLQYWGTGPIEDRLKKRALALDGKVIFNGFESDQTKIYPLIQVLVVASQYEAFGRVTAEAMSFGVPVVGLNSSGTSELLHNGHGLLFDGTVGDLVEKLRMMITDKNFSEQVSAKAWSYAKANFTQEAYTRNFISILSNK